MPGYRKPWRTNTRAVNPVLPGNMICRRKGCGTAWKTILGCVPARDYKEVYFVDNGLGGVFVITASYIVEAAEGTGVRLHSMIETFKILASSDHIQILMSEEAGITTEAVE